MSRAAHSHNVSWQMKLTCFFEQNIFAIQPYAADSIGEGIFSVVTTCLAVVVSATILRYSTCSNPVSFQRTQRYTLEAYLIEDCREIVDGADGDRCWCSTILEIWQSANRGTIEKARRMTAVMQYLRSNAVDGPLRDRSFQASSPLYSAIMIRVKYLLV